MERYEITQSLVSSWQYMFDCFEGCEEDAEAEFLSALRREKPVLDEKRQQAIDNGIAFENAVYAVATGNHATIPPKIMNGVQAVASWITGAQIQVRIKREIQVSGMTFVIHGVLDALKAGTIFDVKFRNTSFQTGDVAGHYLNSPQHPFYFYLVPEAREFIYLVSDGDDLYTERYVPADCETAESIISRFVDYLILTGRLEEYKAHWKVAA